MKNKDELFEKIEQYLWDKRKREELVKQRYSKKTEASINRELVGEGILIMHFINYLYE